MDCSFNTPNSSNSRYWHWEEAFDKFGFDDGDGIIKTEIVADALEYSGFNVKCGKWGPHNVIIYEISKDGQNLMPISGEGKIMVGYDNPRDYLPHDVIELLDKAFPKYAHVIAESERYSRFAPPISADFILRAS